MNDPRILTHPNIPKPLHGIAPRVIAGKDWWDRERQLAYARAGYCCEACGVHKSKALFHHWLEAHEMYSYDYEKGRLTFVELKALCHACHNFIHSGRMAIMLQNGEIDRDTHATIKLHGISLIDKAGLMKKYENRHNRPCSVRWEDWRMVFQGKEYGPSTTCFEDWQAGKWRQWTPKESRNKSRTLPRNV